VYFVQFALVFVLSTVCSRQTVSRETGEKAVILYLLFTATNGRHEFVPPNLKSQAEDKAKVLKRFHISLTYNWKG